MKTLGWLRAWLCAYWDWAGSIAGSGFFVASIEAHRTLFLAIGTALWLSALCSPKGSLHGLWLRLPPVKWHLHRRWVRAVRVDAAIQRDPRHRAFCWHTALADINPLARAEFVHDLSQLDREMAQAASADEARKEQQ